MQTRPSHVLMERGDDRRHFASGRPGSVLRSESNRRNAVRMIVKPASQFAVADSAMRLDPLSFAADRFAFRPE